MNEIFAAVGSKFDIYKYNEIMKLPEPGVGVIIRYGTEIPRATLVMRSRMTATGRAAHARGEPLAWRAGGSSTPGKS